MTIDTVSAVATLVGSFDLPSGRTLADLSFDPASGVLYGWLSNREPKLYTVNLATGHASLVGDSGLLSLTGGQGLAFDDSGTLYFAGEGTTGMLRTIDPTTAHPTGSVQLQGYASKENINSLAFGGCGLYGVTSSTHHLIQINPVNGMITTIGGGLPGDATDGIAFARMSSPTAVPAAPSGGSHLSLDFVGPNPNRSDALLVSFTTPVGGAARLELLDLAGRRVMSRALADLRPGEHRMVWEGLGRLPAGAYFARLVQGGRSVSRKTLLLH